MILETKRLYLREMCQSDYHSLCKILQDAEVMYAYEHAFSDAEVQAWLDNQLRRYMKNGFGLWAVILKETGEMIGQCGLTMQPCFEREVLEVGYLFQKAYWHKGYASEAAIACKEYAFQSLGAQEVFSIVRDSNLASQRVAWRNGMTEKGRITKHYYGTDMPHIVYSVRRGEELLNLQVLEPDFSICKVADFTEADLTAPFCFVGKTDAEISFVCPTARCPKKTIQRSDGWKGFRVIGTLDFSMIGIIADISARLADAKIGIFTVSTFNTDYIFTKSGDFPRALAVLKGAGYAFL